MLYNFKYSRNLTEMLYGYQDEGDWYSYSDYRPIVNHFGDILVENHDSDYQGDTRYLIQSAGKIGFLIIGWGSCSGCDALQSCSCDNDLRELVESLWSQVKWFDTLENAKNYLNDEEREGSYYTHASEWKNFINEVNNYQV